MKLCNGANGDLVIDGDSAHYISRDTGCCILCGRAATNEIEAMPPGAKEYAVTCPVKLPGFGWEIPDDA